MADTYPQGVRARLGAEFKRARGVKPGKTAVALTKGVTGSRQLAALTKIPRNTIASLEAGTAVMTYGRAFELSEALGKDVDRMLPLLAKRPSNRQVLRARDAIRDVPLDLLVTVAHAAGIEPTRALPGYLRVGY